MNSPTTSLPAGRKSPEVGRPTHGPQQECREVRVSMLGRLPMEWRAKRLRFCASVNPVKSEIRSLPGTTEVSFVPMEAVHEFGGLSLDATRLLDDVLTGYTYFRDGDIVVAKITPCFENGKGSIAEGLHNGIGFGTTELHVIRPGAELDRRFMFFLTLSDPFRRLGAAEMYGAGGQKRVPDSFIRDFIVPLPPLPKQRAIAAFLEQETRRIDGLIAKKRRLIELLAEKRAALISHAVTKGLDADAARKPTGTDWLGDVPAHWSIKQLKFAVTFQRGHDLPLDDRCDGDVSIVTSAGRSAWHNEAAARGPGIVTGRYGTIGTFHLVEEDYWPLNTTLYSINLRSNEVRFLWYMLHSLTDVFLVNAGKSAVPGVDRNDLHPILVAIPPIDEQQAIASYLDCEIRRFDQLASAVQIAIDKLGEHRSALISAAVTGKIDVREAR